MPGEQDLNFVTLVTRIGGRQFVRWVRLLLTQRRWVARFLRRKPFEHRMKRLNLIHFARWFVVPRLPLPEDQAKLLLFVSNFDRDVAAYIASFVDAFGPDGLATQWGDAPGWPGDDATVNELVSFALDHELTRNELTRNSDSGCGEERNPLSYKAYEWATTSDVRSALHVDREARAFARESSSLEDDDKWHEAFLQFLARVQPSLGRITGCPADLSAPRSQTRRSTTRSFLVLAPVDPSSSAVEIRRILSEIKSERFRTCFERTGRDPQREVLSETHTARLGLLTKVFNGEARRPYKTGQGQSVELRTPYILFSAEFQSVGVGSEDWLPCVQNYLKHFVAETWELKLWQLARNGKDRESFVDYICTPPRRFRNSGPLYKPTMEFIDYPTVGPSDIRAALLTHTKIEQLVTGVWLDGNVRRARSAFHELIPTTPGGA